MILFKSCPRCTGDRVLANDFYGCYVVCLACGFVSYPETQEETERAALELKKSA